MPDAADAKLRPVPFKITEPDRIPAKRYYDEAFYRLECERLWPHVWQYACRLEQIQNVGDWIEYKNLGLSVVVVRTREGVKAYENTCRHRGVKLVQGHGNCETSGLTCPFHGWRWDMNGKNTFVYGRGMFSERQLDAADLNLPQVRVETWAGCAFINYDHDAPPLRETLGPIAERLEAHNLQSARAEWWFATVLPCNWKLAMEAFMEAYHVMRTHPELYEAGSRFYSSRYEVDAKNATRNRVNPNKTTRENAEIFVDYLALTGEGMAGMVHAKDVATARGLLDADLPQDPTLGFPMWMDLLKDEVTRQGRARGEPTPDIRVVDQTHPVKAVEYIFPHTFFLPMLSSFSGYRIRPLGPESCYFELWSLTLFPEGQEPAPIMEPTFLAYDSKDYPLTPQQDYSNLPRQQEGLHAPGFEFMRLSEHIEGLISNYQRVIDGYLAGVPLRKLAEVSSTFGGAFDGPVREFEFQ